MVFQIQTTTGWGSGNITLNGPAQLNLNAGVSAIISTGSLISLDNTATFNLGGDNTTIGVLSFGETALAAGTYTAGMLNTMYGTTGINNALGFLGAGNLTVVPEPSTVVLALLFGTGMLFFFRRRRLA